MAASDQTYGRFRADMPNVWLKNQNGVSNYRMAYQINAASLARGGLGCRAGLGRQRRLDRVSVRINSTCSMTQVLTLSRYSEQAEKLQNNSVRQNA